MAQGKTLLLIPSIHSLFVPIQVNFGESFTAWIHVKALRVFVESVLRWCYHLKCLYINVQRVYKFTEVPEITDCDLHSKIIIFL